MLTYPHIDPVALQLGPVAIHWYGLTYLAAFGLFMLLGLRRLRHEPFASLTGPAAWTRKDVEDILFLGVVGVIVGGRLGYCLFYKPGYYAAHPLEIFAVWQGGMSFHGGLLGVIVAATAASGLYLAEQKRNRTIDIKPRPVAYTTDAQTIERGRYLYASRGCSYCHGAQGTGREFVNDGKGTRIVGPNITPAGVVARYPPEDWNSVIRHGVKPNGRPLLVMPSEDYNRLTDADLGAIVAHLRQLPSAQGGAGTVRLPLPARVLYGFGAIPDAADKIDHSLPPAQPASRPRPGGATPPA